MVRVVFTRQKTEINIREHYRRIIFSPISVLQCERNWKTEMNAEIMNFFSFNGLLYSAALILKKEVLESMF